MSGKLSRMTEEKSIASPQGDRHFHLLLWELGNGLQDFALTQLKIVKIRLSSNLQSSCPLLATTLMVVIPWRSAGRLVEKLSLPL
jgi:hypothetical protein